MSTTPAGWYPDPHDGRSMRWWDGHAWTEHVQPLPTEAPPPDPAPASPSSSSSSGPALAIFAAVVVLTLGIGIAVFATGAGGEAGAWRDLTPENPTPPPVPEELPPDEGAPPEGDVPDEGPASTPSSPEAELAAVEGDPVITGGPLPLDTADDPVDDPGRGLPVPVVEGAGPDGAPVSLGGAGEPHLVLMVASWCPACHAQLPEFDEWRAQGLDDDVEVVVVVTLLDPGRPGWPADEWATAEAIPAELLMDDRHGTVGNAYGLFAVPFWVVIDAEGRLVQRQAGVITPDEISELAEAARTGTD